MKTLIRCRVLRRLIWVCYVRVTRLQKVNTFATYQVISFLYASENGTYLGMDIGGTNFRIVRVVMKDGQATTDTTYFELNKQLLCGPCDEVRNKNAFICLTQVLLSPNMPCLTKQCRYRSVGFFRSQLIWICAVCHLVSELVIATC